MVGAREGGRHGRPEGGAELRSVVSRARRVRPLCGALPQVHPCRIPEACIRTQGRETGGGPEEDRMKGQARTGNAALGGPTLRRHVLTTSHGRRCSNPQTPPGAKGRPSPVSHPVRITRATLGRTIEATRKIVVGQGNSPDPCSDRVGQRVTPRVRRRAPRTWPARRSGRIGSARMGGVALQGRALTSQTRQDQTPRRRSSCSPHSPHRPLEHASCHRRRGTNTSGSCRKAISQGGRA